MRYLTGTTRYRLSVVLLCIVLFIGYVLANDTMVKLGAGGLVPLKTSQIAMESENLEISVHQVRITYRFRNLTAHDVIETVAFPLPELNGAAYSNSPMKLAKENELNFVDFQVWQNGKLVPVEIDWRAYLGEKDVTDTLKSVGLSPVVGFKALNAGLRRLNSAQVESLERQGLIVAEDNFSPGILDSGTKGWWASWTLKAKFYWTQRFPAKTTVELVQTYTPVVGGSYIVGDDDGRRSVGPYCGGADNIKQIRELKLKQSENGREDVLYEKQIQYILTTANNWAGPIQDFHLSVLANKPEDILATCMPVTRIAPTRYEMSRKNFRPDRELELLLLQTEQ